MLEFRALVGETIAGVEYVHLRWDPLDTADALVDDVSIAVRLQLESGRTYDIGWDVGTGFQQLALDRVIERVGVDEMRRTSDMSARWHSLIGETCRAAVVGSHRCEDESTRGWALRLELGPHRMVVALGEMEGGVPRYSADNLLVAAGPEALQGYRPPAALSFPW